MTRPTSMRRPTSRTARSAVARSSFTPSATSSGPWSQCGCSEWSDWSGAAGPAAAAARRWRSQPGRSCSAAGRRLEEAEARGVRVEPHVHAERQRLVDIPVTDGKAGRAGQTGGHGELAQYVSTAVIRFGLIASGERAECDAAYAFEHAGELEMRPHAVDAVRTLALVLEQEDGAVERRQEGSAEHPRENREVAAEQDAFGHASHVSFRTIEGCGRTRALEQREQPLGGRGRQASELRQHGPVDAAAPVSLQPKVKRGDVGEADQRLERSRGCDAGERLEEPGCTIAAAGAEHRADAGIGKGAEQLFEPSLIAPGEITMTLEDPGAVLDAVPLADHRQPCLEGAALEAARGGDHCNPVAAIQRRQWLEGRNRRRLCPARVRHTMCAEDSRRASRGWQMIGFLLWLLLLVLCWPLALLALIVYPILWLLLLPLRLVGIAVEGVFELLRAIVMLPARVLGGGRR